MNCLNIEDNNSISEFLTSNYSLKYAELKNLDISSEENVSAVEFLHKTISSPNKNMVAYIGYPTLVEKYILQKQIKSILKLLQCFCFQ